MATRMKAFDKLLRKNGFEPTYTDAPQLLRYCDLPFPFDRPEDKGEKDLVQLDGRDMRGWYLVTEVPGESKDKLFDMNLPRSQIMQILESNDYEGIIGFSQGACALNAYLCSIDKLPSSVKWAISIASFGFDDIPEAKGTSASEAMQHTVHLPLMLVAGKSDKYVPFEQTQSFHKKWAPDAVFLEHEDGHCVPSKRPVMDSMLQFIAGHSAKQI